MDNSPTLNFRNEEELREYITIAVKKEMDNYPVPLNTPQYHTYNIPTYPVNDQVKIKLFNNIEFQSNSNTFLKSLAIVGTIGLAAAFLLKKE